MPAQRNAPSVGTSQFPRFTGHLLLAKLKQTIAVRISRSPHIRMPVGATLKQQIPIRNGKSSALWVIPHTAPLFPRSMPQFISFIIR